MQVLLSPRRSSAMWNLDVMQRLEANSALPQPGSSVWYCWLDRSWPLAGTWAVDLHYHTLAVTALELKHRQTP